MMTHFGEFTSNSKFETHDSMFYRDRPETIAGYNIIKEVEQW